jgi:peptide-methionine (S)-S-oxide reductase
VDYDPGIVSFSQLLAAFWDGSDAAYPPYSQQYRSAIFYTTDRQKGLAEASKLAEEAKTGKTLYTSIEPEISFYVAEDYHQKYYLQSNFELAETISAIYPNPADFRDSTASARLNGYLGGYGDLDTLKKNLDRFGLTESGKQALLSLANSGLTQACPVILPPK